MILADFLLCLHQSKKRMKRISAVIALVFACFSGIRAQSNDVFVPIAKYIAAADVESLSAWFAPSLEVSMLNGMPNDCSKTQAKQILKAFFKSYEPESFIIDHQAGRGTLKYALGRMKAGNDVFVVTIFVSYKDKTGYQIQQLKVEKAGQP